MPYRIKKQGNKYAVIKQDDGKVMGVHVSEKKAKAQVRALYASERKK